LYMYLLCSDMVNKLLSLSLSQDLLPGSAMLLLHPFNGIFSRTTWVSWYQKGKTSLDLTES